MVNLFDQSEKTILIVDDSSVDLMALTHFLVNTPFNIDIAKDGLAALHKLDAHPDRYALVIADIGMPRINGIELLHIVKQFPALNNLPLIMLTSSMDEQHILQSINLGAFDYLSKPINELMLLKLVNHAIEPMSGCFMC